MGKKRQRRLGHETLEERCVLSSYPVITEFMASNSTTIDDGLGGSSDWVEIYNSSNSAIDLGGWHLTDNDSNPTKWTFPTTILESQQYLLVFASNQATAGFIDPSGYRHTTFALSAGGEYLALTDPAGAVVSEFAPEYPPQSTDISYGIDDTGAAVYFTNPTPGAANDSLSALAPAVLISEIMYHPSSELPEHEYIELYNTTGSSIDLEGWTLEGAVEYALPAVSLAAGDYLVVAADASAFASLHPAVTNVVGGWQGQLSNRGETILLSSSNGQLVDSVTYTDQGDWADRQLGPLDYNHRGWVWSDAHDGDGSSLELVSFGLSNNSGQNWKASSTIGGTPGVANSVQDPDDNVAPLVVNVTHYPVIPSSTDLVTITAKLVDELANGVSGTLFYRTDGAPAFQALAMSDSGLGGDATSGDHVFTAQLPAMTDGTIVEFYVQAEDQAGNTRTYPSPTQPSGEQLTNLLYQVDDGFDSNDLPAAGEAPIYRLIMTEAERAELQQIGSSSSDRYSHARMNGTLVTVTPSGVDFRYRVGFRNRGQSSSSQLPNSYHVDIPRDDLWQGLEAFNLNTQYTHSQLAGLKLFQATGAIAEDSLAVEVLVNGADLSFAGSPSYGVYVQIEAADGVMIGNHYPDDDGGNFYKAVRSPSGSARADFRDLGDDPAEYAIYYEKQTNVSEADYSDIMELVQVLNYEPDETFYDRLSQIVDVDQWLNYFATLAILGSQETSLATGVGDDYLMYRGENDPRFQLIPHDFDTILGRGDTTGSPTGSIYRAANLPLVSRILLHPQILPAYHARLQELLTTTFSKASFDLLLDSLLTSFTPADQIAGMKSFMDARRDHILDLVTQSLTAESSLVVQGGLPRTTQDNVALLGTAPLVGTQSVTANGIVTDYDVESGQWSVGESTGAVINLMTTGHIWHYLSPELAPTTSPGSDWRADNLHWPDSGPSELGFGDTQATDVPYVDTDPNQSGTQKNITTYFQTTFDVTDAAEYTSLTMELLRDDGAVVYLNGTEIVRSNMPGGFITSTTPASGNVAGGQEATFFEYSIDPTLLVEGENVLAVEIHQDDNGSSDISLDVHLLGVLGNPSSAGGVPLVPGVNRIEVNAYDGQQGTGRLLGTTWVDVWYDNAAGQSVSGVIDDTQHWTAADGPYLVTGDLTITGAGVLTIDPGVTVFFNNATGLAVTNGGQLVAEGTADAHIRFAPNPALGGLPWDGLSFTDTQADNRLTYVDQQGGGSTNQAVFIDHGRLTIDHTTWLDVNVQILDLEHPTLTVTNSMIPGISGNETVHLFGLDQGEQLVFENNVFGMNTSGDDVIDLGHDTLTPATIVFRGNTFLGGFDDGVDTDGFPVLLENNVFSNFHLNTSRPTTSNAVSSGYMSVGGQAISSQLTLIGNVFFDNDHHLLLKDLSFATLTNNTMVGATYGAIHLEEPGGTSVLGPGRGVDIDGVLFWDNPLVLEGVTAGTELTVDHSIVPSQWASYGVGNLSDDPLLSNPAVGDLSLSQGSPAIDAGPNGSDIGALQLPDYLPASAANLRLTEIHFDPLPGDKLAGEIGGTGRSFEFIELANLGMETIDLSNVAFDKGVEFTFPWLTSLAPGETVVVVDNTDLFVSRYGDDIRIVGEYSGNLSGNGERLRLRDAADNLIAEVTYGVNSPWPDVSGGYSLEVINPLGDPDLPTNWLASATMGGTPGSFTPVPALPGDYDRSGTVDTLDYQLWKEQFGQQMTPGLGADGNLDGLVSLADYAVWRNHLGATTTPAIQAITGASSDSLEPVVVGSASSAVPGKSSEAEELTIDTEVSSTGALPSRGFYASPLRRHDSEHGSRADALDEVFADFPLVHDAMLLLRRADQAQELPSSHLQHSRQRLLSELETIKPDESLTLAAFGHRQLRSKLRP